MDDEDINIGADDECFDSCYKTPSDKHEDAAFDYTGITPAQISSNDVSRNEVAQSNGTSNHNIQAIFNGQGRSDTPQFIKAPRDTKSVLLSQAGFGEFVKENDKALKAKQKREKKNSKRAAGWTTSKDIDGHVDINDMEQLCKFVGEPMTNGTGATSSQSSHHKKKLRKKTSKQGSHACNGVSHSPAGGLHSTSKSSDSSDSEERIFQSNGDMIAMEEVINPSNGAIVVNAANHFSVIDGEFELPAINGDEFQKVHHKKKGGHRQPLTGQVNKSKSTYNNHTPNKPNQYLNGHINTNMDVGISAQQQPVLEKTAVERASVDLNNLSSFPALASQSGKSVMTQPTPPSYSWAKSKMFAKPSTPTQVSSAKHNNDSKISPSDLNEQTSVMEKPPTLLTDSKCDSMNMCISNGGSIVSDAAVCGELDHQALFSSMTRSASSVSIEFGTDIKTDDEVQHILSQSFTEGQNIFKLGNQSRHSSKSKSAKAAHAYKTGKSKGVEFLDKYSTQSNHPNINISFGYETSTQLAQVSGLSDSALAVVTPAPPGERNSLPTVPVASSPDDGNAATAAGAETSLPHSIDILPSLINKAETDVDVAASSSLPMDNFNIHSTVAMLKREWDDVMNRRNRNGSRDVVYWQEFETNN